MTDTEATVSSGRKAVIVLGMHRSGTSALAGALSHAGLYFGEEQTLVEAEAGRNDKGYYELKDLVLLDDLVLSGLGSCWDDIGPVDTSQLNKESGGALREKMRALLEDHFEGRVRFGMKDPRMCRLLPLWISVFEEMSITPVFVIVYRHPAEVVRSLMRRDDMSAEKAALLWVNHQIDIERDTRGYRRRFVAFDELLNDWRSLVSGIQMGLGIELSPVSDLVDSFLSPGLRHAVAEDIDGAPDGWSRALYELMEDHASADDLSLRSGFDAIAADHSEKLSLFLGAMEGLQENSNELVLLRKRNAELVASYETLRTVYEKMAAKFEEMKTPIGLLKHMVSFATKKLKKPGQD